MKKYKTGTLVFTVCAICIFSLFSLFVIGCGNKSGSDKDADKNKANKVLSKENKDVVEASGTVKSSNIVNISLTYPAEIIKINVKEGQKVKKGDSLLSINLEEIKNQISSKSLELDSANLELKNAKKDREILDREDKEGKEARPFPEESTKDSRPAPEISDLKYKADNSISMLKDKISIIQNEINSLNGKINKAYIKDKDIICNMDNAVVAEIGYKNGDTINPAQKVLTLLDLNSIYIEAKINEEFTKDVQVGRKVTIKLAADSSRKYTGKVVSIPSSAITSNGETFLMIQVAIDNKDEFLIPNYNVDIQISRN